MPKWAVFLFIPTPTLFSYLEYTKVLNFFNLENDKCILSFEHHDAILELNATLWTLKLQILIRAGLGNEWVSGSGSTFESSMLKPGAYPIKNLQHKFYAMLIY